MKKGQRNRMQEVTPGGDVAIVKPKLPVFRNRLNLSYFAQKIGGKRAMIDHARLSNREEVRLVVEQWDAMTKSRQNAAVLEDLCDAADIDHGDFIGEVVACLYHASADFSKVLVAVNQHTVIENVVKFGKKEKNWRDREMFLKGSGFLPVPTTQIGWMLNNNMPGQAAPVATSEQTPDGNLPTLEQENASHKPFEK